MSEASITRISVGKKGTIKDEGRGVSDRVDNW